ncbi:hypothetical protein GUITHDRAFT_145719 [Guillardia theta CCMP2712]|uniref:IPT/TIG domain-containing protein n=1 Tax=Guillardia theta (strain CCMP2712) TaxID=905079 RepID=L1IKJ7_GUITC|nr:hypothetical protein GUITHDRAFT_145719 [Guillardia theta CCMP2712]EKX36449.1 hypothetical protein GUITHDRAFT_145719 [Guillardia theta CCMP2712]|eukprot:XP_005823429.1 hypothetical protein GUITHDRAFT_145719 [Guillardia theta CCMP2712]
MSAFEKTSTITVHGFGFGNFDPSPQVKIGNTFANYAVWKSPTVIEAIIRPGTGENLPISVYEMGHSVTTPTGANGFSYSAPVIRAIKVNPHGEPHGPVTGGYEVTIQGSNFGTSDQNATVKFNASLCSPLVWTADSSVVCFAPRGIGTRIPVSIAVPNGFLSMGRSDGIFNYDSPVIQELQADTGGPYTYDFEGGARLTIFGINFDAVSKVKVGKRPSASGGWQAERTYDCFIPGTFYINSTTSPEPCYEPPKKCVGGLRDGLACVDTRLNTDCEGGGLCTPDWCSTPVWWGARGDKSLNPSLCASKSFVQCSSNPNDIACDPCSLMCPTNWYTKYESAHKICSVERLQCELPAEGGRFNVMVELAGQESQWVDCTNPVIDCSKRVCGNICMNGPNVGQSCTTGPTPVCQGGTQRDSTVCTPQNPVECGAMNGWNREGSDVL